MTGQISYALQIGTVFDAGQDLIPTLRADPFLRKNRTSVPRTKVYQEAFAERAASVGPVRADATAIKDIFGFNPENPETDSHCVLSITELMQTPEHFCPAGDWLFDLGVRAARYRAVLDPSPVSFMISLRNPAIMLSEAWASNEYPGFHVMPPDPFRLYWSNVLRDLRQHVPDAPITVWSAEDSPVVWGRVLKAALRPGSDLSMASETHIARQLMSEEGGARLDAYLESHPHMPDDLRARVIAIFLDRFIRAEEVESDIDIPGWTEALQEQMDAHYAADLEEVRQIEGVTVISAP